MACCTNSSEVRVAKMSQSKSSVNSESFTLEQTVSSNQSQAHSTDNSRRILILGKVGVGKSTLVNHIVGKTVTPVQNAIDSVTRQPRGFNTLREVGSNGLFHVFKVIDTVGQYELQTQFNLLSELQSLQKHLNLIVFVIQNGHMTKEEKCKIESVISHGNQNMSFISALVVTYCEHLDEVSRKDVVHQMKNNEHTRDIAAFMQKGIFTVGFPDMSGVKDGLKEVFEETIASDEKRIRKLIQDCGTSYWTDDIFYDQPRCFLL